MSRTVKTVVAVGLVALAVALRVSTADTAAAASQDVRTRAATVEISRMAAAGDIHAGHALDELARASIQAAPASNSLPADDAGAKARLAASPRKGEYVKIDVNGTPMTAWVVLPTGTAKAPVVVVIQEIFGLSDWIRGVADQLAAEGFVAVAPDLLSGRGPNGGDTPAFSGTGDMMKATLSLGGGGLERVKAARAWGLTHARANGKSATVGFCFGGAQSFAMAVDEPSLNAAVVYYGQAPSDAPFSPMGSGPRPPFVPTERLANIKAPVLGFYGDLTKDAGIGSTIAPTVAKMKALGKIYESHVYAGAEHGFLRAQMAADGANERASQQAWPLTVAWIRKYAS